MIRILLQTFMNPFHPIQKFTLDLVVLNNQIREKISIGGISFLPNLIKFPGRIRL